MCKRQMKWEITIPAEQLLIMLEQMLISKGYEPTNLEYVTDIQTEYIGTGFSAWEDQRAVLTALKFESPERKPNNLVSKEWHKFSYDNPDTYPTKTGCYLCLTIYGMYYELCWNAISQRWCLPGSSSDFYNPLEISHYRKLPTPPLNWFAGIELKETK